MWLNARGGTKAFLARRRGSIPGKLPQQTSADEVEEAEEPLELDAVTRPAYQHGTTDTGPSKGSPTKGSGTSKEHPVERVNLEWQNICCSYAAAHGKVNILHDIWGKAAAGEMQVGISIQGGSWGRFRGIGWYQSERQLLSFKRQHVRLYVLHTCSLPHAA